MSSFFPPRRNVKLVYQGIGRPSPLCPLARANDLVCFLTKSQEKLQDMHCDTRCQCIRRPSILRTLAHAGHRIVKLNKI